jgi:hypothetical protein
MLEVAERIVSLRHQRDAIDQRIAAAKREHHDLFVSIGGGETRKESQQDEPPVPEPPGSAPDVTKEPMRWRVLRALHESATPLTTEQVAAKVSYGEPQVRYTLQDLRTKLEAVDKPFANHWQINERGRLLLSEASKSKDPHPTPNQANGSAEPSTQAPPPPNPPKPAGINADAVPPPSSCSVRIAVLKFFAAQTVPVPQDGVENLFDKAGYNRGTVKQTLYDLSSIKWQQLDRSSGGLAISEKGRAALGAS